SHTALPRIFSSLPRPPSSTLYPYTTLFRSCALLPLVDEAHGENGQEDHHRPEAHQADRTVGDGPREQESDFQVEHDEQNGHQVRSEEHTSELQSRENLVCRLLLEKKKTNTV